MYNESTIHVSLISKDLTVIEIPQKIKTTPENLVVQQSAYGLDDPCFH